MILLRENISNGMILIMASILRKVISESRIIAEKPALQKEKMEALKCQYTDLSCEFVGTFEEPFSCFIFALGLSNNQQAIKNDRYLFFQYDDKEFFESDSHAVRLFEYCLTLCAKEECENGDLVLYFNKSNCGFISACHAGQIENNLIVSKWGHSPSNCVWRHKLEHVPVTHQDETGDISARFFKIDRDLLASYLDANCIY